MDLFWYALTAVLFDWSYISANIQCRTGQQCIPLRSCPALNALVTPWPSEGNAYMQSLICGYKLIQNQGQQFQHPKVCCNAPREVTNPTPPSHPTIVTPAVTTRQSNLLPEQCGSIGERIVGGEELPVRSYMWMALLVYSTTIGLEWQCGGSLISERYVVTAAHCIFGTIIGVRLGEHDISKIKDCDQLLTGPLCADDVQDFRISLNDIIVHPDYNKRANYSDDIALIRLKQPANLNRYVQPICLPPSGLDISQFLDGRIAEVAGWGRTHSHSLVRSNVKRMVEVPFVDLETCRRITRLHLSTHLADKGQICFGGKKGKDSCTGDSGGPLVSIDTNPDSKNLYTLLGAVSYGLRKCGTIEGVPAVYTDVSYYREWIVSNLRP